MFIDFRKAFDTVDPKRLAKKLKRLGLSSKAVKLMVLMYQTAKTIGNFAAHVIHIKKQITPYITLWRKGKYIPVDKPKQLYFAYVQSHIYCIYGPIL